jgi:hypothetical protein
MKNKVILFSSAEMLNNAMSAGLGLNYTSKIHKFGVEARLKVSMKFKGKNSKKVKIVWEK